MNLCLYAPEQEENIFIRKRAQTWQRSGFLTDEQLRVIEERTPIRLTETSLLFRILYFIFTCICLTAAVGLVVWLSDANDERPVGFIFLIFGLPMYALAEYAVRRYHLYRHGLEEALALLSLLFFCGGIMLILISMPGHPGDRQLIIIAATLAGAFAYWLYLRFGFLYAALIGLVSLCIIPFQFSFSIIWERTLVFLLLYLLFLISLGTETEALEDFRKKRKGILQACLFAGIYLSVNLRIVEAAEAWFDQTPPYLNPYAGLPPEAYWVSYVLTFIVPVAGLYLGIKARKRALMNTAAIALVLTLATNKDYLGLKHYAWDPILLGAMLILAAILIIRWLATGRKKERNGFTADRILKPERDGLNLAEIAAAAVPGMTASPVEAQPAEPSPFENGQSGGGGAARGF